jgi:hypothetical protein
MYNPYEVIVPGHPHPTQFIDNFGPTMFHFIFINYKFEYIMLILKTGSFYIFLDWRVQCQW